MANEVSCADSKTFSEPQYIFIRVLESDSVAFCIKDVKLTFKKLNNASSREVAFAIHVNLETCSFGDIVFQRSLGHYIC